jgi:ElaB/YqjD/DUF883 family membrane-anchored ribosome-binding protein
MVWRGGAGRSRRVDVMEGFMDDKQGAETTTDAGRMGRAKEFIDEKYSAASDAVKEKYSAVREKVDQIDFKGMTEQLRAYVRSNPGKALLISVGVGFVIGLLMRRSDVEEDED